MNIQQHLSAIASGVDLIRGVKGMTKQELIGYGAPADYADELLALYSVYFGDTSFTGKQRAAQATSHDLLTLQAIEKFVRRTKTQRDGWNLRVKLCATPAAKVARVAREFLRELYPPKPVEDTARISRGTDKSRITLIADANRIAEIWDAFEGTFDSFETAFFNGTSKPAVTTNVVITLDQLDQIIDGDGDEVTLKLFNGATISGAEYINRVLSTRIHVGLFHPEIGPVNAYQSQRFANRKQRRLCKMENPTWAWPGCHCPADNAQFHHIVAFKDGGPTNAANLVTLCAYHNAINSDSGPNVNGKMLRIGGETNWLSPAGLPPIPTGIYAKETTAA